MPTRADYEAAAASFANAAEQVAGVTATVESIDAGQIIHGGSLGHQVPSRIASSAATARTCHALIEAAADTCRERAAIIAEYEVRLVSYDLAFEAYRERAGTWNSRYHRWWRNPGRFVHPGARPLPPPKPVAPPSWAEVRRP